MNFYDTRGKAETGTVKLGGSGRLLLVKWDYKCIKLSALVELAGWVDFVTSPSANASKAV
jgi:hypothetical protein